MGPRDAQHARRRVLAPKAGALRWRLWHAVVEGEIGDRLPCVRLVQGGGDDLGVTLWMEGVRIRRCAETMLGRPTHSTCSSKRLTR